MRPCWKASIRRGFSIATLGAALLLGGCTAPLVTLKPPSSQHSGTHLRDWNAVAGRIADSLQSGGLLPPPSSDAAATPSSSATNPIYVHVQGYGSTFLNEVRSALQGEIIRRGGVAARTPAAGTVVNLEVETVRWSPRPPSNDGALTALGAAAGLALLVTDHSLAAGGVGLNPVQGALATTALGVVGDVWRATNPNQFGAEVAWQASVYTADRIAFRLREPMYVRTNDLPLYQARTGIAPVATSDPSALLPVRPVRYAN